MRFHFLFRCRILVCPVAAVYRAEGLELAAEVLPFPAAFADLAVVLSRRWDRARRYVAAKALSLQELVVYQHALISNAESA